MYNFVESTSLESALLCAKFLHPRVFNIVVTLEVLRKSDMTQRAALRWTRSIWLIWVTVCGSQTLASGESTTQPGGGGFWRPEGPSGEGTGGVSPPVGGGSGGLPRENFEKMMQNGAIWSVNKAF